MPLLKRQTSGSVVCAACGSLVGVRDERCYNCGRSNPGLWGFAPLIRSLGQDMGFVPLVVGACGTLYVISLLLSGPSIRMQGVFTFLSPSVESLLTLGAAGAVPVFGYDRWWTVLSAGWLHGGLLHVLFNMLWVRQLAPPTAETYGPGRLVIIYTVSGVCGFTLSTLAGWMLPRVPILGGAALTVGASASIFGLLGALVYYGRRSGSRAVHSEALGYALILGMFGFIMPGVDNYAHLGGFGGGYLMGRWLDPLEAERIDHIAMGLVCLAASALAVIASVVHAMAVLLR